MKTGVFTLSKASESELSASLNKAILEELDEHQKGIIEKKQEKLESLLKKELLIQKKI